MTFDEDKVAFLRATNFFSRAFARDGDVLEVNRGHTGRHYGGIACTVLTITELIDHFEDGRSGSRVLPYGLSSSKSNVRSTFERVQTFQEFRKRSGGLGLYNQYAIQDRDHFRRTISEYYFSY